MTWWNRSTEALRLRGPQLRRAREAEAQTRADLNAARLVYWDAQARHQRAVDALREAESQYGGVA